MKTLAKIESLLNDHRERVSLLLIMLVVSLHLLSCESMLKEAQMVKAPADQLQVKATIAFEISSWAPQDVSHTLRYFYLPSIDADCDSFVGQFVYFNGIKWVYAARLPAAYAGVDLHTAPLVFLQMGIEQPWKRPLESVLAYPYCNPPQCHSLKQSACSGCGQPFRPENPKAIMLALAHIGKDPAA